MRKSAALLLLGLFASGFAAAEVVVVVNPRNPVASLTAEQVAQIYSGAVTSFPGGGAVVPFDQAEGSAPREEFLARVVGKTAAQYNATWSRLIFSGKGTRPKPLASSAEVRKAVSSDATAIGFIERAALDDSVKAVLSVK